MTERLTNKVSLCMVIGIEKNKDISNPPYQRSMGACYEYMQKCNEARRKPIK